MQFEKICTEKMYQASGIQATRVAITLRTRNRYNEKIQLLIKSYTVTQA